MADLPALPHGLTARPLYRDDVAAVAALLAAAEQIDDTGEYPDADDLAEWWTGWRADPRRDGLAVCDAAGLVVAYAIAFAPPGVGRALLDWLLDRGTALHAERRPDDLGALVVNVAATIPSLEALVRRAGLTPERWFRYMQRPSTDLPVVPPVPGIELVPFSWDRDDEVRRAHNAAFTEHHGSSERDAQSWVSLLTGQRAFRPELSVLALEDGVVAGYVLAYVYEADTAATGVREVHLGQIGVLPHARGGGRLASAMIGEALQAGARNGCAGGAGGRQRQRDRGDAAVRVPRVQRHPHAGGLVPVAAAGGLIVIVPRMVSADQPVLDRATVARAHRAVEPLHSQLYFAPEHDERLTGLGLKAGRMTYFAGRAAAMGPVGAGVVTATFYSFSPSLVAHMIPRAWTIAAPEQVLAARLDAARASMTRLLGGPEAAAAPEVGELAALLREASTALAPEGRPLYAGHADLPWPGEPLLDLWHGATLLREHRGDGHLAALLGAGLSGLEALITHTATGRGFTEAAARAGRGWREEEWTAGCAALARRGLLDDAGLTAEGEVVRARVEAETDELSAAPWEHLGHERTARATELAKGFARALVANGAFAGGMFARG